MIKRAGIFCSILLLLISFPFLTLAQSNEAKSMNIDFAKPTRNFFLIGVGDLVIANGNGKVSGQVLNTENLYIPWALPSLGGGIYGTYESVIFSVSASTFVGNLDSREYIPDHVPITNGLSLEFGFGISPLQIADARIYPTFGVITNVYNTSRNLGSLVSVIPQVGIAADYLQKLGKIDEKSSFTVLYGLRATFGLHKIGNTDAFSQYNYTIGSGLCLRAFVGFGISPN